jgi:GTP-binding protein
VTDPVKTEAEQYAADIEAARVLFARPVSFVMGAVAVAQLPPDELPEVAFAGRSNVGKSSLINALVGQNHLARASNEPGRTRELNFFLLNNAMHMVDLPGYGWARASKVAVKKFQNLGRDYLRGRPNLKRAYLLIDARHGLKEVDNEPMDALDKAAVSYQLVLTKADKIKPAELAKVIEATQGAIKKRPAAHPIVLATSSETGFGIPELRLEIMQTCGITL